MELGKRPRNWGEGGRGGRICGLGGCGEVGGGVGRRLVSQSSQKYRAGMGFERTGGGEIWVLLGILIFLR